MDFLLLPVLLLKVPLAVWITRKKTSTFSQAGFQQHTIYHYADQDLLELADNDLSSTINHISETYQSINLNNAIELTKSKNIFSNSRCNSAGR